jgi:hypothetical protein
LEAGVLAMMVNYIIVIIRCALPMRRNKSTDCCPFDEIAATTL